MIKLCGVFGDVMGKIYLNLKHTRKLNLIIALFDKE